MQRLRIWFSRLPFVTAAVILTCVCMLLCGCSANVKISVAVSEIKLAVGESRDVLPYIIFDPSTEKTDIRLDSDSDCLEVRGTTVTAVKPGSASVTVKADGSTAVLGVMVSYRSTNNIYVTANNAVQTVAQNDSPKKVTFTAELDFFSDPDILPEWEVRGETYTGKTFEYTPPDYGEYTVTVRAQDVAVEKTVGVYRQTNVTVTASGALEQVNSFSPVTLTAREQINTLNPRSVIAWSVNGEVMGNGAVFRFTPPQAGEYVITLNVNGENKKILGEDSLTVSADGARAPNGEVTFDDEDGVYIRWADGQRVNYVSILTPNGTRLNFDVTDAACSHLFGDGFFKATEYIDVCAVLPDRYTVMLGAEGRSEFVFTQLPERAREYIDSTVFLHNSYIKSGDEAEQWVRELHACGITEADCYVGGGAESVVGNVYATAAELGLNAAVTTDGEILSVRFAEYVNAPKHNEAASSIKTLYAVLPHIEYDGNSRRESDHVFALDRANTSVEVSGSEQLLCAALCGVKPIPEQDSVAAAVYAAAKGILIKIIGSGYDARQKIHAIYDWLQWVTVKSGSGDPLYGGMYLEGVFCSSRGTGSGYAVTDGGAAKAFALMCRIEGIDCVLAYDGNSGRRYNRVMLDGLWYNVDVYGGKISGNEIGASANGELTSHRGLLIDDGMLANLGITSSYSPDAFDISESEFLVKDTYGNIYFDHYIDKTEVQDYNVIKAAVFAVFDVGIQSSFDVPYIGSDVHMFNSTYGFEFAYSSELTDTEVQAVVLKIQTAIAEYVNTVLKAEDAIININTADNIISVTVLCR